MWMASLIMRLCQSISLSRILKLVIDTLCPVLRQCSPTHAGDVIDRATLSFLRGLILGMNEYGPHGIGRLVLHRGI